MTNEVDGINDKNFTYKVTDSAATLFDSAIPYFSSLKRKMFSIKIPSLLILFRLIKNYIRFINFLYF